MKRRVLTLSLTLVVGISLGIIGGQVLNAQQEPVKRTVLQKVDLGDKEGVPPKQVHGVTNASKTAPAKILGFLLAEKGQPMTTPVK